MCKKKKMIQNLLEELNSIGDDEENDWLNLLSAIWAGRDLALTFEIKDLSEDIIVSKWLVKCLNVIFSKFSRRTFNERFFKISCINL